jgi:hypothetical protein
MVDLPLLIEHLRRFDARCIEEISSTIGWWWSTEQESDLTLWDGVDITIDISPDTPWDIEPRKKEQECSDKEYERDFTHAKFRID